MRRTLLSLAVLALASACADSGAAAVGPASSGSLASAQGQLPPPGASLAATPAPQQPPAEGPRPIGESFDPAKQRFVWVLPPGIHGKGPWIFSVTVKQAGEVKHESKIPLKAELVAAGSRPEYPAGYEIVRLTDDGSYQQHAAELDKIIAGLVAQYGLGKGELEMQNELSLSIDEAQKKTYCVDNKTPDIHIYIDEVGKPDLVQLDVAVMAPVFQASVKKACGN